MPEASHSVEFANSELLELGVDLSFPRGGLLHHTVVKHDMPLRHMICHMHRHCEHGMDMCVVEPSC